MTRADRINEKLRDQATRLSNLAALPRVTGRHDEAEPLSRQVMEITRQTLGETHPTYATRLNYLAVLFMTQGKHLEPFGGV
ncbi:MAG: hypothetical protein CSA74_01510 [Rhodobacterales bacterium]|nr:MAG: hypothetical protein CSA74_01510 [Rhodobacterales bacterium]